MDSGERDASDEDEIIRVLVINWNTVQVYMHCEWTLHIGMSQPYYQGMSAREIRAACSLLRTPHKEWPGITRGISQVMVPAAQNHMNRAKE